MDIKEFKEIFGAEGMDMTEEFKKEFEKKMLDLYKLLRSENMGLGEVQFKNGIVFRCEIDTTNWVDKPVLDWTDKVEKEDEHD